MFVLKILLLLQQDFLPRTWSHVSLLIDFNRWNKSQDLGQCLENEKDSMIAMIAMHNNTE